jgi:biotin transport system substrate-specific component
MSRSGIEDKRFGGSMNRNSGANEFLTAGVAEAPGAVVSLLRGAGIALAGSLLIAVCAHLSIPLWFTPVPITLQPFAVLLLGLLLGPRLATGTMLAYLAEGATGLPVFTPHGLGGIAQLVGPTGGYLLSYPIVAPLISTLWRRGTRSFSRGLLIAGAGSLVTLVMGAAWFGILTHTATMTILTDTVLPFLPGDVLKVCAAAGIAAGATRFRRREL